VAESYERDLRNVLALQSESPNHARVIRVNWPNRSSTFLNANPSIRGIRGYLKVAITGTGAARKDSLKLSVLPASHCQRSDLRGCYSGLAIAYPTWLLCIVTG